MPVYEYVCVACGHRMEVIHGIHATGPATCDACGGPLRRALSAPAIVFKGSGWAKKDARASSRPKERAGSGDGADGRAAEKKAGEGDKAAAEGSGGSSSTSATGPGDKERGRSGRDSSEGSGASSRPGD